MAQNQDRWDRDFTEIRGIKVRKGDKLKINGKVRKIAHIIYINIAVDRWDFEDGTFCFSGDDWEKIKNEHKK